MGADGYFEHDSADGTAFWKRIGRWYPPGDGGYWSVGENLLWSSPRRRAGRGAQTLDELARASGEHPDAALARDRRLRRSRRQTRRAPTAGATVTIITTDFGVRR